MTKLKLLFQFILYIILCALAADAFTQYSAYDKSAYTHGIQMYDTAIKNTQGQSNEAYRQAIERELYKIHRKQLEASEYKLQSRSNRVIIPYEDY